MRGLIPSGIIPVPWVVAEEGVDVGTRSLADWETTMALPDTSSLKKMKR